MIETHCIVDVHDPGLGLHATIHLALPGVTLDDMSAMELRMAPPPGTMCGAVLGPLVGLGPADEIKRAAIVDRPDWKLCERCFPHG